VVVVINASDGRDRVALWRADSLSFRLWLSKKRGDPGAGFGVWLPFDRFFAERAALATAFWRTAADPPVSSAKFRPVAAIPAPLAVLRRRTLRALDGRLAGASYRAIAALLFGPERLGETHDWKNHAQRAAVIRLVKSGLRLVQGGYRQLLVPIKRQPRQPRGGHP